MISFKKVDALPLSKLSARVVIRWEMNVSGSELADYEFCVKKQTHGQDGMPGFQDVDIDGTPKTPKAPALNPQHLVPVSAWIDGLDFPWFVDHSDYLRSLADTIFYKVVCRNKKTQESIESVEFTWDGDLDLVGIYICEEVNFLLKDAVGVPALFYQRRRGGVTCTKCFDPIQKKRLISNCGTCYGTNWVGGFFNPIDTYIDFNPNPKNNAIEAYGEVNNNDTSALMANFPNAMPGDIIREIRDAKMWRVVAVSPTEKRRCQMLQMLRLTEIKAGDVEYRIAADEKFLVKKIEELNQIKAKPEF